MNNNPTENTDSKKDYTLGENIIFWSSIGGILYFFVIIIFYIKSAPNDFVWWGDINYEKLSNFGTHVAGIAAIFAFILVFATYLKQVEANKEQSDYIKKKEQQLDNQVEYIKQLVYDNKHQSNSQITQLTTLATHINTMVQNNQEQYSFDIKEKSFYSLLDYFDTTVNSLVLLKDDRVEYISQSLPSDVRVEGKQALQQMYEDIRYCLVEGNCPKKQTIEEAYNKKTSFLNYYFTQIMVILEKIDELPTSHPYIDLFHSKLCDEEKYLIIAMILNINNIKNSEKIVEKIKYYNIFVDLAHNDVITMNDVDVFRNKK